jgi:hypothetical protein
MLKLIISQHTKGSRVIIVVVQVRAVKIYPGEFTEGAFRKKEKQDET